MIFFKKFLFLFTYQKAIVLASHKEYLEALNILEKAKYKKKFFLYFLLAAFLYERLGELETSLLYYDKAKYMIFNNKKINEDEKNYLLKYINQGYINIYNIKGNNDIVTKYQNENILLRFDYNNINNTLKKDFVMSK